MSSFTIAGPIPDEGGTTTSLEIFNHNSFIAPGLNGLNGTNFSPTASLDGLGILSEMGKGFGQDIPLVKNMNVQSSFDGRFGGKGLSGVGDGDGPIVESGGGFDFGSFLGGTGTSLLIIGGVALLLLYMSPSAREKRGRLSDEKKRYQTRVRRIKQTYGPLGVVATARRTRRGAKTDGLFT